MIENHITSAHVHLLEASHHLWAAVTDLKDSQRDRVQVVRAVASIVESVTTILAKVMINAARD